jgi:hypothetical protein
MSSRTSGTLTDSRYEQYSENVAYSDSGRERLYGNFKGLVLDSLYEEEINILKSLLK